jgi:hypothetical protein
MNAGFELFLGRHNPSPVLYCFLNELYDAQDLIWLHLNFKFHIYSKKASDYLPSKVKKKYF